MAESKNNVITHGLSGKVGDLIVFRSRFGRTFVSSKPKERTGELSVGELLAALIFNSLRPVGSKAPALCINIPG